MNQANTIVCRCEEVTYETILQTATSYQCSSRELKLRTRAGMGYCGGRTCRPLVDHIAIHGQNHEVQQEMPLKCQPPIRPIPFSQRRLEHE